MPSNTPPTRSSSRCTIPCDPPGLNFKGAGTVPAPFLFAPMAGSGRLQCSTGRLTVYSMQNAPWTPVRDNLSDALANELRNRIVDGRLPAGERINEVHLSAALGVSRTPLREALNRLALEGALINRPRIGYTVRPLTLEEFEQVYDVRPLLDPEALRLAGLPSPEGLKRLRALNRRIEHARDPDTVISLDDEWHLELIAPCPNKVLIELVELMIHRTRRYEIALM